MNIYDVIIVGGGPAGLNAAIVLSRCQRRVMVFDTGTQRNLRSHGIHNFLTRDGIKPAAFLRSAHGELKKYGVRFFNREVRKVVRNKQGLFEVNDNKGMTYLSRRILIATGIKDNIPDVEGFNKFYGKSIFHCPYCDGWEVRNKKLVVYASKKNGTALALSLKTWSNHVILVTDGIIARKIEDRDKLRLSEIPVITKRINKVTGRGGKLKEIVFEDGDRLLCDAIFFVNGYEQQCQIVNDLGCIFTKTGVVSTNRMGETNVKGVYVAGDASKDVQFVVVAAAEGAKAGVAINKDLQKTELGRHPS